MRPSRIRDATAADAAKIARLQIASWRAAYRGILPDAYLDGPIEAERHAHWQQALAGRRAGDLTLILDDPPFEGPGGVIPAGFLAARIPGGEGFGAYIDNLHVRPDLRGRRLGSVLLAAGAERMMLAGAADAFLWLFDGNDAAGRFYQRLGGTIADRGFDDFLGGRLPHTRIVFADLPALAQRCRLHAQELLPSDSRSLFQ